MYCAIDKNKKKFTFFTKRYNYSDQKKKKIKYKYKPRVLEHN